MATIITSECINCGACEPECPNHAIYQGGAEWELNGEKHAALTEQYFYIVPDKCTECVGSHDHEACAAVCPVDCCVPNSDIPETEDQLIARARQLHPDLQFPPEFPSRFRAGAPDLVALKKQETLAPKLAPAQAAIAATPPPDARQPAVTVTAPPPGGPEATRAEGVPAQPAHVAAPEMAEQPPAAGAPPDAETGGDGERPPVSEQPKAEAKLEKLFAHELEIDFAEALAAVRTRRDKPERRSKCLASLRGRAKPGVREGKVGQDGFRNAQFDDKLERERRYGEVYRLREESNGFLLELEFPRRVPPSAIKEQLGIADEMPEYDYDLRLQGGYFIIRGSLLDEKLRRVAAVSPAFPPDFLTRIQLPASVAGFKHRVHDKTLEVALLREA